MTPEWRDDLDDLFACCGEAQWACEARRRIIFAVVSLEMDLQQMRRLIHQYQEIIKKQEKGPAK